MPEEYRNIYKNARRAAGYTQETAAEQLGLSVESVRAYETGQRIPPNDVVEQMVICYNAQRLAYQHLHETNALMARVVPELEQRSVLETAVRIYNRMARFQREHGVDRLMAIAEDGQIDQTERAEFDGDKVYDRTNPENAITLDKLAQDLVVGEGTQWLTASASHCSPTSPPPFMAGFAEVEVDLETGETKVVDYVGVVDCGTVINKNLARVQAEGGIAQGIGMAMLEDVNYDPKGQMVNSTFMTYKIPSRTDLPEIRVDFEESYEPNGPFGAKSIGEVVINTPLPAISDAIYNAIGTRFYELPITPEQIAMAVAAKQ